MMMPRISILLSALLLAAPAVPAQDLLTVKLHDGRTLIGRVVSLDGNAATLDVSFPVRSAREPWSRTGASPTSSRPGRHDEALPLLREALSSRLGQPR